MNPALYTTPGMSFACDSASMAVDCEAPHSTAHYSTFVRAYQRHTRARTSFTCTLVTHKTRDNPHKKPHLYESCLGTLYPAAVADTEAVEDVRTELHSNTQGHRQVDQGHCNAKTIQTWAQKSAARQYTCGHRSCGGCAHKTPQHYPTPLLLLLLLLHGSIAKLTRDTAAGHQPRQYASSILRMPRDAQNIECKPRPLTPLHLGHAHAAIQLLAQGHSPVFLLQATAVLAHCAKASPSVPVHQVAPSEVRKYHTV